MLRLKKGLYLFSRPRKLFCQYTLFYYFTHYYSHLYEAHINLRKNFFFLTRFPTSFRYVNPVQSSRNQQVISLAVNCVCTSCTVIWNLAKNNSFYITKLFKTKKISKINIHSNFFECQRLLIYLNLNLLLQFISSFLGHCDLALC